MGNAINYRKLYADMVKVQETKGDKLTDEQKDALDKTIELLDQLDEQYEQDISDAIEYAEDHANIGVKPNGDIPQDTVAGYTTTLYTTETAESDPAFDEALEKYPDVDSEEMSEMIRRRKESDYDYVLNDMLPDLKIHHMTTIRTHNYWNGSKVHVVSIEDATMKDLFGIATSCHDYQDYMIYCKDGHLRIEMQHHDATDHCVCLNVIDSISYNAFMCSSVAANIDKAEDLVKELIDRKIAISIVPEIARMFGIELKEAQE